MTLQPTAARELAGGESGIRLAMASMGMVNSDLALLAPGISTFLLP